MFEFVCITKYVKGYNFLFQHFELIGLINMKNELATHMHKFENLILIFKFLLNLFDLIKF